MQVKIFGGNTMKKRFLGIVMALCMAVYFLPAIAFAASFPANPIKVDLTAQM